MLLNSSPNLSPVSLITVVRRTVHIHGFVDMSHLPAVSGEREGRRNEVSSTMICFRGRSEASCSASVVIRRSFRFV